MPHRIQDRVSVGDLLQDLGEVLGLAQSLAAWIGPDVGPGPDHLLERRRQSPVEQAFARQPSRSGAVAFIDSGPEQFAWQPAPFGRRRQESALCDGPRCRLGQRTHPIRAPARRRPLDGGAAGCRRPGSAAPESQVGLQDRGFPARGRPGSMASLGRSASGTQQDVALVQGLALEVHLRRELAKTAFRFHAPPVPRLYPGRYVAFVCWPNIHGRNSRLAAEVPSRPAIG